MTDRPLKILITDPHLKGGGQVRYVTNLAHELMGQGHQVTIGCKRDSVLVERARQIGCLVHDHFEFRGGLRPLVWWRDYRQMRSYLRETRPDIVHTNGSQDHWICALANPGKAGRACVVRTRHNTYPVKNNWPNRVLNREWTDFEIIVCDYVRRVLAAHPAFDPVRMVSIHNGVDADLFHPDEAQGRQARSEFGYTPEQTVCGIVARLVPAKGHEFLFQAAGILTKDFPQLRILVLGRGEAEDRLRQLAQTYGIGAIVNFAGFREDMPYCLQAIDIGVQPSIDCDTSSFSLKELMAAEKPVVASDYGGLTEIVTDGEDGLVVPAGTAEPLAEALRSLLRDRELRHKLGEAGRRRVLRDFTVQVFARRTLDAYHQALEVHRERLAH
ncbi:MAG: glycosyltransferase family 4 protein [Candidatus Hydrogenedentes bacterium]|nr:glycosyltransferase family 4 protein [Candidatus Hydrogenedentota bacterium]